MTITVATNRLDCCRPYLRYTGPPELYTWSHSLFCKEHRGVRLSASELDIAVPRPGFTANEVAPALHQAARAGLKADQHQAERDLDESGCPAHGGFKPWRDCPGCAAEVQAVKERGGTV